MDQEHSTAKALISLGSNLGDVRANIFAAFEALETLSLTPARRSSIWRSEPVDSPPGSPTYANAAACLIVRRDTDPSTLLRSLLDIELNLGRQRNGIINEPRIIDLDLVCVDQKIHQSDFLQLPHPRSHLRKFVLSPLAEIEPGFIFPTIGLTITTILRQLPDQQLCRKWEL
ncbi:2-amino-4-hydroxy-6-hydroxymethyldihydropteridine diphosphokinase [Verrucomicrobia bacterium]|jgi:2-amino-4-hydroxy-6-hydroxymethyldihydropteridine diphosphokinase|nr:2-amino-4-hydroxy-6-hydroxymethyldihydropteridine diphosphokinase [Verrucomicrobiota bacterium]MDC0268074.1 2-amino-4-hydroxy-6-hydroxymethyldihydropteridine diphosphokinase [bacterium]MDG1892118.1 2-amino-4-hydroxy-6-hydroxymethyldihydropteridine diphosphokinase [Verrucomicrobiota bacterium]